jgi:hypothetical protein
VTSPRARIAKLERQIQELAARQVEAQQASELDRFAAYRGRELDFCRDTFLDTAGKPKRYWAAQRSIITRLFEKRFVAVRSARKGGKTEVSADAILAFVQTRPSIVVSTASGGRQVETGLWSRIRAQYHRTTAPLLGECLITRLNIGPNHWAIGFSTNDSTRFAGFHAGVDFPDDPDAPQDVKPEDVAETIARASHEVEKRSSTTELLLAFDECFGVDEVIWDAARGSMLGEHAYVLAGGNPTREYEEPHESCRMHHPGSGYWRICIDARDDPDDVVECDERFTLPPYMARADELEQRYQKDDPLYRPMVRGQFMIGGAANRVIPYDILKGAEEPSETCLKRGAHIGFDTAWKGDDANVAALYVDSVKVSEDSWHGQDTLATWDRMKVLRDHWSKMIDRPIPWRNVHMDAAPVAAGILDTARRERADIDAVDFGGKPTGAWRGLLGPVNVKNRRAEMYLTLRELLRKRLACIPRKYEQSWRELAATQYSFTPGTDQYVIEPKEAIRSRLGKSPDHADADVLAFARSPTVAVARVG